MELLIRQPTSTTKSLKTQSIMHYYKIQYSIRIKQYIFPKINSITN